jgi:hypothetical protein
MSGERALHIIFPTIPSVYSEDSSECLEEIRNENIDVNIGQYREE